MDSPNELHDGILSKDNSSKKSPIGFDMSSQKKDKKFIPYVQAHKLKGTQIFSKNGTMRNSKKFVRLKSEENINNQNTVTITKTGKDYLDILDSND